MELARVLKLAASLRGAQRSYFRNFVVSLRDNPLKRKHFEDIEAELATLDAAAWEHVKANTGPLFMKNETDRDWRGAASALNEARAYNLLVRRGYTSVAFIPRHVEGKTPDLRARMGDVDILCEAKTINRSERAGASHLFAGFFTKLASTIKRADEQIAAFAPSPGIKRIVYLAIDFDEALHAYVEDYLAQIQARRTEFVAPGLEIVLDVGARVVEL